MNKNPIMLTCDDCSNVMTGPRTMDELREQWDTLFCDNCEHKHGLRVLEDDSGSPKRTSEPEIYPRA